MPIVLRNNGRVMRLASGRVLDADGNTSCCCGGTSNAPCDCDADYVTADYDRLNGGGREMHAQLGRNGLEPGYAPSQVCGWGDIFGAALQYSAAANLWRFYVGTGFKISQGQVVLGPHYIFTSPGPDFPTDWTFDSSEGIDFTPSAPVVTCGAYTDPPPPLPPCYFDAPCTSYTATWLRTRHSYDNGLNPELAEHTETVMESVELIGALSCGEVVYQGTLVKQLVGVPGSGFMNPPNTTYNEAIYVGLIGSKDKWQIAFGGGTLYYGESCSASFSGPGGKQPTSFSCDPDPDYGPNPGYPREHYDGSICSNCQDFTLLSLVCNGGPPSSGRSSSSSSSSSASSSSSPSSGSSGSASSSSSSGSSSSGSSSPSSAPSPSSSAASSTGGGGGGGGGTGSSSSTSVPADGNGGLCSGPCAQLYVASPCDDLPSLTLDPLTSNGRCYFVSEYNSIAGATIEFDATAGVYRLTYYDQDNDDRYIVAERSMSAGATGDYTITLRQPVSSPYPPKWCESTSTIHVSCVGGDPSSGTSGAASSGSSATGIICGVCTAENATLTVDSPCPGLPAIAMTRSSSSPCTYGGSSGGYTASITYNPGTATYQLTYASTAAGWTLRASRECMAGILGSWSVTTMPGDNSTEPPCIPAHMVVG